MNYSDPKLQSLLAAQYVLGNMHGQARARFKKLLIKEPGLREAVDYWQLRLNPLAEAIDPVVPHNRVWKNIKGRVQTSSNQSSKGWLSGFLENIQFAHYANAFFVLVITALLVTTFVKPDKVDQSEYLAILKDTDAKPSLVAKVEEKSGNKMLSLEMLGPDATGPEEIMQVWCVPKDGQGEPVSIGLLNKQRGEFNLSIDELDALHESKEITITFESIKESPVPQPKGQIMYRGDIII